jgi:DNA-directed RNA polymerase subunit E'/Rpb7
MFRLVVFRPFIGEVILAKVKSSDAEKIRCWYMLYRLLGHETKQLISSSVDWVLR